MRRAGLSSRASLAATLTFLVAICWSAEAQGPEGYALPHLFALPTATTARQFGMGGMSSCMPDVGFPNPAFAGALEGAQGGLRAWTVQFEGGLDLTGTQAWYATRVAPDQGIQVLMLRLDSRRGTVMTADGPLPGELEETDAAVHYGRRLSEQWLVGVGMSPIMEAEVNLYHPVAGSAVLHTDSVAELGGRIGALYQWAQEGFAGFVLDWYTEDVGFRSVTTPETVHFNFTSTEWALGLSARVSRELLAAAEWMELESRDTGMSSSTEGLHLGLEYAASERLSVRVGSNDGALSLGAGGRLGEWVVNYAWIGDWNDDSVGALLGGSDTHQLEVGAY
ncbi:MAG: hypothetical protein AB7Y46_10860 [Armatimonadota bacterium]